MHVRLSSITRATTAHYKTKYFQWYSTHQLVICGPGLQINRTHEYEIENIIINKIDKCEINSTKYNITQFGILHIINY